jgi:thiamine-monophosphate kinase
LHSTISSLGERALIQRITSRLALPPWVVVGPGDDAAVIEPERGALEVLTTDAQVEGVHFDRRFVPPDAIGHRALGVNLSDVAAMGAAPRGALLSLVLPDALPVADIDGLLDGLLALAARHRVTVVGGNITRSPGPLVVDVTVTGSVKRRQVLTRAGARPGHEVYVTGTIGDAMAGLQSLQTGEMGRPEGRPLQAEGQMGRPEGPPLQASVGADLQVGPRMCEASVGADLQVGPRMCEERYLRPEPRVRAGVLLGRNRAASACMDLSDGLADGIRQVAEASGVGMTIDATALPIGVEARRWYEAQGLDPVMAAVAGGDDYELLFTVRPDHRGRLRAVLKHLGDVPITRIGAVTKERRLVLRTPGGDRDVPYGFEHFR